jgi:hypothetical protein
MHYTLVAGALEEIEAFMGSLRKLTRERDWKPVCCA